MSQALVDLRRYQEAVDILKKGLAIAPGNQALKNQLALVQSYLAETSFIKRRRVQAELDALTKRDIIRCTMLKGKAALAACNSVLELRQDKGKIYRAKGNALLSLERYAEAIPAFRKALQLDRTDFKATAGLKTTEIRRQAAIRRCKTGKGSAALKACQQALLAGQPDQVLILKRQGELLLAMDRKIEALRAYQSAQKLSPKDKKLIAKINQLTTPKKVERKPPDPKPVKPPVVKVSERKPPPVPQVAKSKPDPRYSNNPSAIGITH